MSHPFLEGEAFHKPEPELRRVEAWPVARWAFGYVHLQRVEDAMRGLTLCGEAVKGEVGENDERPPCSQCKEKVT